MSRVHVVSLRNLIGTARARRRKLTTFPRMLPDSLLPPFLRREPGNEAKYELPVSYDPGGHNH